MIISGLGLPSLELSNKQTRKKLAYELKLWYRKLPQFNANEWSTVTLSSIKFCGFDAFSNLFKLLSILLNLPVTS